MKVILLGELKGKGGEGDIVEVAQGYAENYLFPNHIALPATPGNIKQLEEHRHNIAKREEQRISGAEATKAALDGKIVRVQVKAGDEGQLFGSVTTQMIADAVAEQLGVEIDRKRIERSTAIKMVGLHEVAVGLYREISANLTVEAYDPDYSGEEEPAAQAAPAAEEPEAEEEAPAEEAEEAAEEEVPAEEPADEPAEDAE